MIRILSTARVLLRRVGPALPFLGVLGVAALFVECASLKRLPQEPGFHPRLTPTTYLEEGKLVAFAVDTNAAGFREKQAFIPLPVSVQNKGLPRLTLTRESFTLIDDQGHRTPMATVEEGRSLGGLTTIDYEMSGLFFDVTSASYANFTHEDSVAFFPTSGGASSRYARTLLHDRIELAPRAWMADILYFPHPRGQLTGRKLEMWLTAPELPEPVFVKFTIKPR